jgi:Mrp family chromosome partitioning ATPase
VIIDSSPIFAADDAACLAPRVDGTLFVVRSRFSPAGAVKEALDLLGQRQVRVLGLVFNRAETSSRGYYYYKNPEYYRSKKTA